MSFQRNPSVPSYGQFDERKESSKINNPSGQKDVLPSSNATLNALDNSSKAHGITVTDQVSHLQQSFGLPHDAMVDASLLENIGKHQQTDPHHLIVEESGRYSKRKAASIESILNTSDSKKNKKLEDDSANLSSEEQSSQFEDSLSQSGLSDDDAGHFANMNSWAIPPIPTVEPLPVSVTLPYIRSFTNKKFHNPISLFTPPLLPVGQLHHFPALLTIPPLLNLPTMIPLYPTGSYPYMVAQMNYYAYSEDSGVQFSEDNSEEEEGEVEGEGSMHSEKISHVSPLTTLASLASGTVKNDTRI